MSGSAATPSLGDAPYEHPMTKPDGSLPLSDAAQPGDASQEQGVCRIRIGSFNVGMQQDMLEGKAAEKHLKKIEHIITTCVTDMALDIMNLCEFGCHKQGLAACRPPINPHEMGMFAPSTSPRPSVNVSNNYLTA